MRNEPFDNAVQKYENDTGISSKGLFCLAYTDLILARADHKLWIDTGRASPQVINFLKDKDKPPSKWRQSLF